MTTNHWLLISKTIEFAVAVYVLMRYGRAR